jgi:hypothetical protein
VPYVQVEGFPAFWAATRYGAGLLDGSGFRMGA